MWMGLSWKVTNVESHSTVSVMHSVGQKNIGFLEQTLQVPQGVQTVSL